MSSVSFARCAAVAAVVLVGTTASAGSADLYGTKPYPPAQPFAGYTQQSPVANWAGAYLGVEAGYSFGTLTNKIDAPATLKSNINGAQIGLYGGVNAVLSGNIIVGAEGDINLSDQNATQVYSDTYKGTSNWNGSVRARVGNAFDRYMPYITAGLAFADNTLAVNGASDSTTQIGIAAGAGIEAFVTDKISLKGEAIYEGFGDASHTIGNQTVHTNISSTVLRIGAAYKF